jgi:hypothetical protein
MGEERYWVVHHLFRTSVYPDQEGQPARRVVCWRGGADAAMDDLLGRLTAEAAARGAVALFRDHWEPREWGHETIALTARAGALADAFRPRPLPVERDTGPHPPTTPA